MSAQKDEPVVVSGNAAAGSELTAKLEVVVIPVSDVDPAKAFYERLGWTLDVDLAVAADHRVVEFTPSGSPTSIIFGTSRREDPELPQWYAECMVCASAGQELPE